jgi:hypothetical protein
MQTNFALGFAVAVIGIGILIKGVVSRVAFTDSPQRKASQKIAKGLSGDPVPLSIRSGAATNKNS